MARLPLASVPAVCTIAVMTAAATTTHDLATAWLATRDYSPASLAQRTTILRRFLAVAPDDPAAIDAMCLVAWWQTLTGLAPASRRSHHSAIGCFLAWCAANGWPMPDLGVVIRRPKVPQSAPKILTAAEVAALRALPMTWRDRMTVTLMLDIGLRAGEVSRMRGQDIDHAAGTISVIGKGGRWGLLPLPESVARMVPPHTIGRLVPASPGTVSSRVSELLAEAGIVDRTGHALRRTFATRLMRSGVDLRTVQALLRHSSIATSQHYLAVPDLERMRAAVAA